MNITFRKYAQALSEWVGSPWAFIAAAIITIAWLITGPLFHFSDTWQLVMNSITNVVTFLIVFLIQNTQNRDTRATQLKLDELIRAVQGARNEMVDLENLSDEELQKLQEAFSRLGAKAGGGNTTNACIEAVEQELEAVQEEMEERQSVSS